MGFDVLGWINACYFHFGVIAELRGRSSPPGLLNIFSYDGQQDYQKSVHSTRRSL